MLSATEEFPVPPHLASRNHGDLHPLHPHNHPHVALAMGGVAASETVGRLNIESGGLAASEIVGR